MSIINCTLLVDDDSINNFINQRLIEEMEITRELSLAENGLEALAYIREHGKDEVRCPRLILLDINMPVMDGFEFLQEFESLDFPKKEQIKIVMLTTSTSQKDVDKLGGYKIAGYINKPLTEEKLMDVVEKIFGDENQPS
ncbi:response regulator [Cesiribacter andamanensis]|uniref:Response regulator rcp1 n=1 Tax=Cesiribacter andamanensis AMV16 TaxID=1279009 RepID=M7NV06_9BACT|nr:response regulator [Cesiribacter andamanensis]EMR02274.1 Response regulator rcp1 [Cesiribacter andamanensis AMV16]